MDLLKLYDLEMRRSPPLSPGLNVDHAGKRVRLSGLYNCLVFSELSEADADEEIESEIRFLRDSDACLEWKVHGHDQPADLAERLSARGFRPDPPETLMIREIDDGLRNIPVNPDVRIATPTDEAGLEGFFAATEAAFGQAFSDSPADLLRRIGEGGASVHVAYLDGQPVGAGRLEMPASRAFAGLYTGGIAPAHRGKGLYRALVRSRATQAAARGYRFLERHPRWLSRRGFPKRADHDSPCWLGGGQHG